MTSTERAAETHSGYLGKSQMTSVIRAGSAPMTMDCVDESAMLRRLPPASYARVRRHAVPRSGPMGGSARGRGLGSPVGTDGGQNRYVFFIPGTRDER